MMMDAKEYNRTRARVVSSMVLSMGWILMLPMFVLGIHYLTVVLNLGLWMIFLFAPAGFAYALLVYLGAERFGRYLLKEGEKEMG